MRSIEITAELWLDDDDDDIKAVNVECRPYSLLVPTLNPGTLVPATVTASAIAAAASLANHEPAKEELGVASPQVPSPLPATASLPTVAKATSLPAAAETPTVEAPPAKPAVIPIPPTLPPAVVHRPPRLPKPDVDGLMADTPVKGWTAEAEWALFSSAELLTLAHIRTCLAFYPLASALACALASPHETHA